MPKTPEQLGLTKQLADALISDREAGSAVAAVRSAGSAKQSRASVGSTVSLAVTNANLPPQSALQQHQVVALVAPSDVQQLPVQSLPPRAYLDQMLIPTLIEGLKCVVAERPMNPTEFLGLYLIKNSRKQGAAP
ncbi:Protein dpy-30 [Entophlyctis luteolus]|nr:Protein dpy-30 [Entophlyctis luteolus]KAJ3346781.1 Protein dpy-30 [Entophlyctis luteolus]KAJ3385775.1 Protein dpy-30 [Entophlyctis sp. JEL0112]